MVNESNKKVITPYLEKILPQIYLVMYNKNAGASATDHFVWEIQVSLPVYTILFITSPPFCILKTSLIINEWCKVVKMFSNIEHRNKIMEINLNFIAKGSVFRTKILCYGKTEIPSITKSI